ncbi:MAG: hypothetical protein ACM3SS_18260 [Rhodospirillaceae bacterium]
MSKDERLKLGSALSEQIAACGLSERERALALSALRNGEAIADAILSVVSAVRSATVRLAAKPRRAGALS